MSHAQRLKQKLIARAYLNNDENLLDIIQWMNTSLLLEERWAFVPNTNNQYKVSNMGRVMSMVKFDEYILKPCLNGDKYCTTAVGGKPSSIHRLVAAAFVANPFNYNTVNHKDEIPCVNFPYNLEWCTHRYNILYSYKRYGANSHLAKINDDIARHIVELSKQFNQQQIANQLGLSWSTVHAVLTGRSWYRATGIPQYQYQKLKSAA
jgi:hypothetical protein